MTSDRSPDGVAADHLLNVGVGDSRYLAASEVSSRATALAAYRKESFGYESGPRMVVEVLANRSYTVTSTDLFAAGSWDADTDPYGLFYPAGSWGGGHQAYARIYVPQSGRYRLDCIQHLGRSGASVGSVAGKIMARYGDGKPTVLEDSIATDMIQRVSATDGPLHIWAREYLWAGTWLYWSTWASPYKNVIQYGYGDIRTSMRLVWLGSV